jgi:hypothetical protein
MFVIVEKKLGRCHCSEHNHYMNITAIRLPGPADMIILNEMANVGRILKSKILKNGN